MIMDASIRRIVVGVAALDGDDPAVAPGGGDPVLAPALRLAESLGATLHVVHAFELPDPLLWSYGGFSTVPDPRFVQDYAARLRDRMRAQVDALGTGARVEVHARDGLAGRVVCALAEEVRADLVVVGATRRGKLWRGLLGTTAERVVRGAPAPVLVVHQPFEGPVRRLLLTTDLSETATAVHERGLDLAEALFTGELEARSLLVVAFDAVLPPPLPEDRLLHAAGGELRRFLDACRPRDVLVEPRVRIGEVGREVAREAEEWGAGVIVVGTSGRSGTSRLLLGSDAAGILRRAPCNVLVIPSAVLKGGGGGVERATALEAVGAGA
jgi:universal stress protein E